MPESEPDGEHGGLGACANSEGYARTRFKSGLSCPSTGGIVTYIYSSVYIAFINRMGTIFVQHLPVGGHARPETRCA
eukprot:1432786-Pyramimonas_sp.AAC.1